MYLTGSSNTAKGGGLVGNLLILSKTNTVRIALVAAGHRTYFTLILHSSTCSVGTTRATRVLFSAAAGTLNSVPAFLGTLISSKSRVYLLKDRDRVGQSASRSVGFSKWTVLIGRTGFDTISSIPDPTLSLSRLGRFP